MDIELIHPSIKFIAQMPHAVVKNIRRVKQAVRLMCLPNTKQVRNYARRVIIIAQCFRVADAHEDSKVDDVHGAGGAHPVPQHAQSGGGCALLASRAT